LFHAGIEGSGGDWRPALLGGGWSARTSNGCPGSDASFFFLIIIILFFAFRFYA